MGEILAELKKPNSDVDHQKDIHNRYLPLSGTDLQPFGETLFLTHAS